MCSSCPKVHPQTCAEAGDICYEGASYCLNRRGKTLPRMSASTPIWACRDSLGETGRVPESLTGSLLIGLDRGGNRAASPITWRVGMAWSPLTNHRASGPIWTPQSPVRGHSPPPQSLWVFPRPAAKGWWRRATLPPEERQVYRSRNVTAPPSSRLPISHHRLQADCVRCTVHLQQPKLHVHSFPFLAENILEREVQSASGSRRYTCLSPPQNYNHESLGDYCTLVANLTYRRYNTM